MLKKAEINPKKNLLKSELGTDKIYITPIPFLGIVVPN
jgi:hypothetical protein